MSIDGDYSETAAVSNLFGLRTIQSLPEGTKSERVSQHYKRAINNTMNKEFTGTVISGHYGDLLFPLRNFLFNFFFNFKINF